MARIAHALALVSVLASSAACGSGAESTREAAKAAEKIVSGTAAPSDREGEIRTTSQLASRGQGTALLLALGAVANLRYCGRFPRNRLYS